MKSVQSLWAAALTLEERARMRPPPAHRGYVADPQKINFWRDTPAFRDPTAFCQFLSSIGLTEELFCELIAESAPHPDLDDVLPDCSQELEGLIAPSHREQKVARYLGGGFVAILAPLISYFFEKLSERVTATVSSYRNYIDEQPLLSSIKSLLVDQLSLLVTRPLVLEMNIASHGGLLDGETPEARFNYFVENLEKPELRAKILRRYPVMVRHAVVICRQWLESNTEMLARICHDRDVCRTFFGRERLGLLVEVASLSGDAHAGGKRVLLLKFGCGFQFVYKPRPQAAAKFFQDFVEWLNARGQIPPLRPPRTLDRGDYGWVEFFEPHPCVSQLALQNYYQRIGAYIAAMYALAGTDCHFENVIAAGEHPILVDVETIFQPRLKHPANSVRVAECTAAFLSDSVMSVGLLPTPLLINDALVDLSGIGAKSFQETPLETFGLENVGTDQMRVTRILFRTDMTKNQPVHGASEHRVSDYLEYVDRGFRQTYGILCRCKGELRRHDGLLARAADATTRVLLRNTAAYSSLLEQSFHPKALRDGLARDRVLWQLWFAVMARPSLAAATKCEYDQTLLGDIPIFWSRANETTLASGNNNKIAGLIQTCGHEVVRSRVKRMCEADLVRQRWLVTSSICSLGRVSDNNEVARRMLPLQSEASYLEIAEAVGRRLGEYALRADEYVSWLSFDRGGQARSDAHFSIQEVGIDLYDGLAGIALFLACLGEFTKNKEMNALARGAMRSIEARLAQHDLIIGFGAFEGLCGIAYAYSHLGCLWNDQEVLRRAAAIVTEMAIRGPEYQSFDLISGAAGSILSLLALHRANPASNALNAAHAIGDQLISADLRGSSRAAPKTALRYQRGMSHGFAGIAYSLIELGIASGEQRFVDEGLLFADAERALLSDGRWTDESDARLRAQATWCHGSPGIALARLGILRRFDHPTIAKDAEFALQDTLAKLKVSNHGLCHGRLGVLETLSLAKDVLAGDLWREHFCTQASEIRRDIAANGCRTDRPGSVEVPGLMTGLAGIGLGMLRLASDKAAPNVLMLS